MAEVYAKQRVVKEIRAKLYEREREVASLGHQVVYPLERKLISHKG